MAKKKIEGVSLNPEDFVEGGGLIDDVDAVFEECIFETFKYPTGGAVAPRIKIMLDVEEIDDLVEEGYTMGSSNDWIPSEDGSQLVAVGKATNIRATSDGGIFLKALIDAGFPVDDLGDDIGALKGLQAHMIRVPKPERPNLKKTKEQKEREERFGPPTMLIVSEIIALPGEKKKPTGAPKKTVAKKKTPAKKKTAEASDDINKKAVAAVMEILADTGTITKKELPSKLFQSMKDDPEDRNAIIKMAFTDEFLEAGPWDYEDGVLVGG